MNKIILLVLLLPGIVFATEKMKSPPITVNSNNTNNSVRTDDHSIDVSSQSDASAVSESSNGDQVSMNSSQFYALSLMFPEGGGCFTGIQGGGHNDDKGGFLGVRFLSTSCWLNQIASTERDIELNARLMCGDRKYRNAIAYDVPRRDRQSACIDLKAQSGRDQMSELRNEVQRLKANNTAMMGEHAKIVEECEAANDRGDERLARCEEKVVGKK